MSTGEVKTRKNRAIAFFVIIGVLLIILGIIPVIGGTAILFSNRGRDSEGYHLSNVYKMNTATHAFIMEMAPLEIESFYGRLSQHLFGTENTVQAKWVIRPVNSSKELFAGFTSASAGENYFSKIEAEGPYPYWHWDGPYNPSIEITTTVISGKGLGGPTKSPALETFWLNTAQSSETFNLYFNPVWNSSSGNNYLIITNLDGASGVAADISLGFKIPVFNWLAYVLIPVGIIIFVCGIFLVRKTR